MQLFTIAVAVFRDQDDQPEIHVENAVALFQPDADVERAASDMVLRTFPPEDGWYDHRVVLREIPAEGMRLDNYWLTWQLHEAPLLAPPAA